MRNLVKPLFYILAFLYLHTRFVYLSLEGAIIKASLKGEKSNAFIHDISHTENFLSIILILFMTILLAILILKIKVARVEAFLAFSLWLIGLVLMLIVV